jgi:hypothetical protein
VRRVIKFQQRFAGLFFTKIGKIVVMLQLLKEGGVGEGCKRKFEAIIINWGLFTLVLHVRRVFTHFDVP